MKWLSPPRPVTYMLLNPGLNNQSSLVRSAATGNIWSLYPLPRFLSLVSRTAHSLGLLPSLVVPSQGPFPDLLMLQGVPRFSSYSSVLYPHSHDPWWSHVFSLSCHHRKMAPSAVITAQPSFLNSRFRNLSAYLTSPSECLIRFVYLTYPNWAPNTSRPQPTPPLSQTTAAKKHTQKNPKQKILPYRFPHLSRWELHPFSFSLSFSPLSQPRLMPTLNLSAKSTGSTFKIYLEFHHFSTPPLLPPSFKPPLSLTWIVGKPPNWSPCFLIVKTARVFPLKPKIGHATSTFKPLHWLSISHSQSQYPLMAHETLCHLYWQQFPPLPTSLSPSNYPSLQ